MVSLSETVYLNLKIQHLELSFLPQAFTVQIYCLEKENINTNSWDKGNPWLSGLTPVEIKVKAQFGELPLLELMS
jgi:hypothetical protein